MRFGKRESGRRMDKDHELKTASGRALLAAPSPVFGRGLERMAAALGWSVQRIERPEQLSALAEDVDLCLVQEGQGEGLGLDDWVRCQLDGTCRTVPVIAFSTDAEAESRSLERGASDFLRVPCRPEELGRLLASWLRISRLDGAGKVETEAKEGAQADSQVVTAVEAKPARDATILLVDDSHVIHAYVDKALEGTGYRVLHAYDGVEGVEVALASQPDLVISDLDMPNLDGYGLCERLREVESTRGIPIVILSARGKGVDIDRGFDVGANDFLTKPVSENELLSRIEMLLGPSRGESAKREQVLVVEDSGVQRSVIVQALRQQGFEVLEAADGLEGLEIAVQAVPDLVITDSEMPEMNGRDLTRNLKKREALREVPVIMLTAADSPLSRLKGKHAGVSAYLTKPFVPDKVVVIAEKLIAERRLLRERLAMRRYLSDSAIQAAREAAAAEGDVSGSMAARSCFATVFFTDIVGFTPLTERLPAKELVALLNGFFDAMAPIVSENGGVIDKFVGDAIMALFVGEDEAGHREKAVAAVRTGLAMQERLRMFRQENEEAIHVRVGINSGPVVMGDFGSRLVRRDYTVIGDHVNLAARLEATAEPDQVLVSASTYELVKDAFEATPLGPIQIKGKSEAVDVYQVEGPR